MFPIRLAFCYSVAVTASKLLKSKRAKILSLVGLWQDLEELLGRKVDLLTDGGISPHLRERIYAEARPL